MSLALYVELSSMQPNNIYDTVRPHPWTRRDRRVSFAESGLHVDQRTEGLIDGGQHSDGGLDHKALLKRIDERAGNGIGVTRHTVRNDSCIPIDARQAATDTELCALKCVGDAADREVAHELTP
jgi:hypothetical protein